MAQQLYDECEDHYVQMKSKEDEEAIAMYLDAVERFATIDATSDGDINCLIREIQTKAKQTNSKYLQMAFPGNI